jgi:hypothetical protein
MKALIAAASALALIAAPALAGERESQISLCAAALDAQGLAAVDSYRVKFLKAKGGAVQKVVVKLIPLADGPSLTAECLIQRGEVTSATIQS